MTEVLVAAGSPAAGRTVDELEARRECRVLAIGDRFAPDGGELVGAGALIVVASPAGLRRLNAEAVAAP